MKRGVEVGLLSECASCGAYNIPRRIEGKVVGSSEKMLLWQCKKCKALWS